MPVPAKNIRQSSVWVPEFRDSKGYWERPCKSSTIAFAISGRAMFQLRAP